MMVIKSWKKREQRLNKMETHSQVTHKETTMVAVGTMGLSLLLKVERDMALTKENDLYSSKMYKSQTLK